MFKEILRATNRIYDLAERTPVHRLDGLSTLLNINVWVKREDFQKCRSFKIRGAYNSLAKLDAVTRKKGVVCASAGNHAQGVASAARHLQIKAIICMPQTTPSVKVEATKSLGGSYVEVLLHGSSFDEAKLHCEALARKHGLTIVPPFDHPDVIAGQGTIGVELLNQIPPEELDMVILPCGGGGLLAGVATYIKGLHPHCLIVCAEPEGSDCCRLAVESTSGTMSSSYEMMGDASRSKGISREDHEENADGCICGDSDHEENLNLPILNRVDRFADGVAVAQLGRTPFRYISRYVDQWVSVSSDEICQAMKDLYDELRAVAEPSGAVALAAAKKILRDYDANISSLDNSNTDHPPRPRPKSVVTILSGANMDFRTLRFVAERCEAEILITVDLDHHPGALLYFLRSFYMCQITALSFRWNPRANDQRAFIGLKSPTSDMNEVESLLDKARQDGWRIENHSGNELVKKHARYLVGGTPSEPLIEKELAFVFQFPEAPGALVRFLEALGTHCNITLFHYRSYGAPNGSVFVGWCRDETEIETSSEGIALNDNDITEDAEGLYSPIAILPTRMRQLGMERCTIRMGIYRRHPRPWISPTSTSIVKTSSVINIGHSRDHRAKKVFILDW